MSATTLLYLYGVVPTGSPAPLAGLRGIDDQPVRLVETGELSGIVSSVDAVAYGEDALEAGLADLAWVAERGVAHERVLTWFADRVPVVPLAPFSLHRDEPRVRERLAESAASLRESLDRVAGRREWMVKLWRDESAFTRCVEETSPTLRELRAALEAAAPGRRYLLTRKLEAARTEELRTASAQLVNEVFQALRGAAEAAVAMPLPTAAQSERRLVLDAAFLVHESAYPGFQQTLSELAGRTEPQGFGWEFTGPWPAYHFVER